jgi:hypothetical protein
MTAIPAQPPPEAGVEEVDLVLRQREADRRMVHQVLVQRVRTAPLSADDQQRRKHPEAVRVDPTASTLPATDARRPDGTRALTAP